ncbi:TetR/AcrR family transcriptional regulator [Bosea caraganae]|uniref:TetR/AcrR family transcriptional regulator n=1 Tax=Bosea caraganae TaxID=2763117 RepID=A0A370KXE7_9HYPH|nr:TetR-like C-terminal domain-containing protein [Bosea caraganae]RDJ19674.1 TetR/AcrR family transcriptional regulator [Bosea caraganae]RDJ23819.1 TetR/AcrR family transcriptional regulator [Bosea caraganae]
MNKPSPTDQQRPYHHGDLRSALLAAAEKILETEGIQALTLRAAARAVGVSHTAPQNHFDDLTGLLSELAAVGYQRFSAAVQAAAAAVAGADMRTRNRETGRAYVRFARAHPGLFALMYRSERLDVTRPALHAAIGLARQALRQTTPSSDQAAAPPIRLAAVGAARWALVHGFALLLIEGRLEGLMKAVPGGVDPDELLDAVFDVVRVSVDNPDV